jgi:four helix bundle protein
MKIERFEELEIWKSAREFTQSIYEMTSKKEFVKDFGLSNQIQRSAVSIMSNIAEGFERKSKKEFIHFLYIAKGSCGEARSQLYVALDLKYIDKEQFQGKYQLVVKISKSIAGFIKYLKSYIL